MAGADGNRLAAYRAMRDFDLTREPPGHDVAGGFGRFVVQRHRARKLHYDLRLELDGAPVSWAVPKGPTLDPKARQLAVRVEDHPLEYLDFEGVIAHGQYGGGDVIVWDADTGRSARTGDPARALARGELHFDLHGEKLNGRFVLVRRDPRTGCSCTRTTTPHASAGTRRSIRVPCAAAAPTTRSPRPRAPCGRAGCPPRRRRWAWSGTHAGVAGHGCGAGGARRPRRGRPLERSGPGVAADEPGQAVVPRPRGRATGGQARADPLHRYPDGAGRPGFWQKQVPDHAPAWLPQWHNVDADPGDTECYAVPDGVAALVCLANFGALELHPWTSALPHVHQPTWALIDIDPGARSGFTDVLVLARLYRTTAASRGDRGAEGHRPTRRADLGAAARGLHLRPDPEMGAEAGAGRRAHRPRPGELGVAQGPPPRSGPARLHPECDQQDVGSTPGQGWAGSEATAVSMWTASSTE
jgi:bifunctional non-homologous end joining protein LigD